MRLRIERVVPFVAALLIGFGSSALAAVFAQYENHITYLGADWGPDGDTVYCLKQILFKKKAGLLMGGTDALGCRIWLCKMRWDGSEKQDIAELWPGQGPYVDTQSGPAWMEVNAATGNIAFSAEYGMQTVGMWIVGLDGKNLHRPFERVWNDQEKQVFLHPSWSPDGTKLVFEDHVQGMRLAVYDLVKKERRQLTEGPRDQEPVWSPKGDWVAYMHCVRCDANHADTRIWLVRPDGSEQRPIVDENSKPLRGWWPSWSPDGNRVGITHDTLTLADLQSHKTELVDPSPIMGERLPYTFMGHHWGKRGWLLAAGHNVTFIDSSTRKACMIAGGGVYSVSRASDVSSYAGQWGLPPTDLHGR